MQIILSKKSISDQVIFEMESTISLLEKEIDINNAIIEENKKSDGYEKDLRMQKEAVRLERENISHAASIRKEKDYLQNFKNKVEFDRPKYQKLKNLLNSNEGMKILNIAERIYKDENAPRNIRRFFKLYLDNLKSKDTDHETQLDCFEEICSRLKVYEDALTESVRNEGK